MKRFRFTLIAVCLFLIWLGWTDVDLFLRNREPATVAVDDLIHKGAPREWLQVQGGILDVEQAISTSGSIELEALLIPLKANPADTKIHILVETRDPEVMNLFTTYHFKMDSAFEKEAFLERHRQDFHKQRQVTGMLITGLIATSNRDKLLSLTQQIDLPLADRVTLISEGKQPASARGFFFLVTGILGLGFVMARSRTSKVPTPPSGRADAPSN